MPHAQPPLTPAGRRAVEHFDRMAGDFRQHYERAAAGRFTSVFTYGRSRLDLMLDAVLTHVPSGSAVLDVGCGTGDYLRRLRGRGFDVTGVEPSEKMRALAVEANPQTPILAGVASNLPLPDAAFDLAISIEVLRYLPAHDVTAACREFMRVVKPGGRVFFTVVNRRAANSFYFYHALRRAGARLGAAPPIPCTFTTPEEVRTALSDAGAADVEVSGWFVLPIIRPAYRLGSRIGGWVARIMDPLESAASRRPWTTALAGGLIVTARRR